MDENIEVSMSSDVSLPTENDHPVIVALDHVNTLKKKDDYVKESLGNREEPQILVSIRSDRYF